MISAFAKGAQILAESAMLALRASGAGRRGISCIGICGAEADSTCCAVIATAMRPSKGSWTTTRSLINALLDLV